MKNARELYQEFATREMTFESVRGSISGDTTGGETPVPIPNTVVKPARADDTPLGESRSLPVYQSTTSKEVVFCLTRGTI